MFASLPCSITSSIDTQWEKLSTHDFQLCLWQLVSSCFLRYLWEETALLTAPATPFSATKRTPFV